MKSVLKQVYLQRGNSILFLFFWIQITALKSLQILNMKTSAAYFSDHQSMFLNCK